MFVLHQMIREYRRRQEMTQEDVANALGVAPQTISKWERAETYPDITLLPALANLFGVTTDQLLGMDQLREEHRIGKVYTQAREKLQKRDWDGAIAIYEQALRIWPNDAGILTDLAMALALSGESAQLTRAALICENVLQAQESVKEQHTARAALCYIHTKAGDHEHVLLAARLLPHQRESREVVKAHLYQQSDWDALLFELSTGEMMS